jgi:glycine cleavage system H protein
MYPKNYRYTREHEWIEVADGIGTVGITDYAQHSLGDIVYVELPAPGAKFEANQAIGTVESVKAVSEIFSPVSGEITAVNEALAKEPEKINQDAHGTWMVKIKLANPKEVDGLLDAAGYEAFLAEKEKEGGD